MTRRPLPWILAMAAVFVAGLLAYIAWPREPEPPPAYPAQGAPLVRPHAPMLGPVDAPVTIVEFFDPSCEGCRAFHPYVKQIVADYRGKVRVVVRYAPLHHGSDEAVAILEAAREQARFEPVLEAFLLRQPEWAVHGAPDLALAWRVAAEAGLDVSPARRQSAMARARAVLEQDVADLNALAIEKTPPSS